MTVVGAWPGLRIVDEGRLGGDTRAGTRTIMRARTGGVTSFMVETPPYPSILHEGVAVVSKGVSRLSDGKLVGTFVAKYALLARLPWVVPSPAGIDTAVHRFHRFWGFSLIDRDAKRIALLSGGSAILVDKTT
jgi:hypothetical protein